MATRLIASQMLELYFKQQQEREIKKQQRREIEAIKASGLPNS